MLGKREPGGDLRRRQRNGNSLKSKGFERMARNCGGKARLEEQEAKETELLTNCHQLDIKRKEIPAGLIVCRERIFGFCALVDERSLRIDAPISTNLDRREISAKDTLTDVVRVLAMHGSILSNGDQHCGHLLIEEVNAENISGFVDDALEVVTVSAFPLIKHASVFTKFAAHIHIPLTIGGLAAMIILFDVSHCCYLLRRIL